MDFDFEKLHQDIRRPEQGVVCNELKALYSPYPKEEEDLIIRVRALDADGLMVSIGTGENPLVDAVIQAMETQETKGATEMLRTALGIGEGRTPVVKRMIEAVVRGSDLNHELAARIADFFPTVLVRLSNVITELTGRGGELKKNESEQE